MTAPDTLQTWAGREAPPGEPPPGPTGPAGNRPRAVLVAGAAGIMALLLVVVLTAGGGDDELAATVDQGAVTSVPPVDPPATTVPPPTTVPSPTTDAPPTADAPPATEAPPTTEAPAAPVDPARIAVFKGGTVYLQGRIASRAEADEIVAKAGAVVGPDNVVDEYIIDPSVPYIDSAPLYVEDRVLFAFGSDRIEPDFVPLLELGMILLTQNPGVTITVVGHTDSSGSAEFNQVLSERRVANVIRYFTDRGIDPARFTPDARGQSDPLVVTGDGQREARNRRVEFIITGLLDG